MHFGLCIVRLLRRSGSTFCLKALIMQTRKIFPSPCLYSCYCHLHFYLLPSCIILSGFLCFFFFLANAEKPTHISNGFLFDGFLTELSYLQFIMENPKAMLSYFIFLFVGLLLSAHFSFQLPYSQSQAILTIQKLLTHPLTTSLEDSTDFCNAETTFMTILCYEDNITQVHFHGADKASPLPSDFSMGALVEALTVLPSLKVVTLVSLGLWGPLPSQIGNCSSLEILNLSSNLLVGNIPAEILKLGNLQTLILDHNMLTGQIPVGLNSYPSLSVLSLKNNSFNGPLSNSISRLENLRILQLSKNNLSGLIPDLSKLTNLQVLDLGDNSFGPEFPSLPNKIVTLVLKRNKFRFGIIRNITSFYQLQTLDVSSNELVGPFPPSILSLPSISYLDISRNSLNAMFQDNTSCGAQLEFVDLSSNILTGNLPTCLLRSSNKKLVVQYQKNCLLNEGLRGQHRSVFCQNQALAVKVLPPKERRRGSASKTVVAMSTVGAISLAGLVLLVVTRVVFTRQNLKKPQTRLIVEEVTPNYASRQLLDAREICQVMKLGPLGLPAYRNWSLEELKEATLNFDKSRLIGQGSLGPVYKGKLTNETFIAVRSLKMRKKHGIQSYTHHIELLSKLRHGHLVSALGHCFECLPDDSSVNRIHLIFEYVPNGTLRNSVLGMKIPWPQRITAAIGIAKGIQFLQTGIMPGINANKIKITDVLLDHDLQVKINHYNLPLLAENRLPINAGFQSSASKEKVKTMPKQDEKSDIYDFGVILLEIITGRAIATENEVQVVRDLFQVSVEADDMARKNVTDPAVSKGCSDGSLKTLMELSLRCLSNERPSIEDVLWNLQFAAQVQDSWQIGDSPSPSNRGTPVYSSV